VVASVGDARCTVLVHRFGVGAQDAAIRTLQSVGINSTEELGMSIEQLRAFIQRTLALPGTLPQPIQAELERARIAADTARNAPENALIKLQIKGCPTTSHAIYRIGPHTQNPSAAYRSARTGGLSHDVALSRARAEERFTPERGFGTPAELELERYSIALVVLE